MDSSRQSLVVVGSGFAGVWAALTAARQRHDLGLDDRIAIRVVSPTDYLGIRPRFYEADLARTTVPLAKLFDPVRIEHVRDRVIGHDPTQRTLQLASQAVRYDALVWAVGSAMVRPTLPGAERIHSVDTFEEAGALDRHLRALAAQPAADAAAATVVVVGGGFTGIEAAAELTGRLRGLFGASAAPRVVLVEKAAQIGPEFGPDARATIAGALAALGVERRTGAGVAALTDAAVTLDGGEVIPARTVVWCAGVQANPATRWIGPAADALGRLAVDDVLRVTGQDGIFAAGDVARVQVDGEHLAMMSCQQAIPQGKYAGHNAMSWLAGHRTRRYEQQVYVTCLDLGAWGAMLTLGFDRNQIVVSGAEAKPLKRMINTKVIYPPLDGLADSIWHAAALPPGGKLAARVLTRLVASRRFRAVVQGIARAAAGDGAKRAAAQLASLLGSKSRGARRSSPGSAQRPA